MKRIILFFTLTVMATSVFSQNIQLPAPQKTGGKPLMEVINQRQSTRSFSDKELSEQTLSNLLWCAYGFNREDKRVVPSANNKQEFSVYVILKSGTYLYDAKANTLILKNKGDFRNNAGKQDFVATAPVNLVYVANMEIQSSRETAGADCGFIAQNVYLFCASENLGTVVRGWFEKEDLKKILHLSEQEEPILTQTVGLKK